MPAGVYPRSPAEERFWSKVDRSEPDGCWLWLAHRSPGGYGRFAVTRTHRVQAHRFAYEQIVGPIPDGLTLDHLCRTRACVNPVHLEPVTNRENIIRGDTLPAANLAKTVCHRGHDFTPENTRIVASGARDCRTCDREDHTRSYWTKRRRLDGEPS